MALEIGRTQATIESNTITTINDKEVVQLTFTTAAGDAIRGNIWLSPKAMGMARRCLKLCGFDADKQSLCELDADPNLLQGNKLTIEIEEYNGTLQAKIPTSEAPPKKRLLELDKALREVKKANVPAVEADEDIPF